MKNNKSGVVIYHSSISEESAIRKASFDEHAFKETASYLRSSILNEKSSFELHDPLTADARGQRQANPHKHHCIFIGLYIGGRTVLDKARRQAQYTADDVIVIVTRDRVEPVKHICLGMGIQV